MKLETLRELNAERAARRPVIVVTDTATGQQRLVKARDFAADPLRAELSRQLRMGKSANVEAGGKKLFFNVYAPTAKLVIIGAVHISQALAPLARSLGYDVTVVDPRTAFASPERFPDIPLVAAGGVNQHTVADFIGAGAVAIGVGKELIPRQAVERRQADWITELARRFVTLIKESRRLRLET